MMIAFIVASVTLVRQPAAGARVAAASRLGDTVSDRSVPHVLRVPRKRDGSRAVVVPVAV